MGFTAKKAIRLAMIGGAIAATAALSACSGNAAGNSSPVKNAADAAAQHSPQGAATGGSGGSGNSKGGDFTDANGNVNCSKLSGKVSREKGGRGISRPPFL